MFKISGKFDSLEQWCVRQFYIVTEEFNRKIFLKALTSVGVLKKKAYRVLDPAFCNESLDALFSVVKSAKPFRSVT